MQIDYFTGTCGHTVKNVPPYLRDCVDWTCRKCAAHDEKSPIKDEPEETHRVCSSPYCEHGDEPQPIANFAPVMNYSYRRHRQCRECQARSKRGVVDRRK